MTTRQRIATIYETIAGRYQSFLVVFFATVLATYMLLVVVDFIPEPVVEEESDAAASAIVDFEDFPEKEEIATIAPIEAPDPTPIVNVDPLPLKIIFDELDREVEVLNPQSRDIADLDEALLKGVVRHPDSADFQDPGNIFILGHSSYLPNVLNKNFQAFNGIQELSWGDTVRLQSGDTEYVYRIDKVYEAKASDVVVPIDNTRARLTLATCDSFGSTDDRFIVEATLVKTVAL